MIKPLTSLRFLFAFMVFLLHICNSFFGLMFNKSERWLSDNIFKEGYIGVGFFFMLSGFILMHTYKERYLNGTLSKKQFWLMRLIRIYPLHLLTLFISIPLVQILLNYNMKGIEYPFLLNFYLLHSYILPNNPNWFWSFNTVSWSVSVEAFFYFSFPFIIAFLNANRKFFFVLLALGCFAVPLLMFFFGHRIRIEWFYINPLIRIVDFLIGVFLYEVYLKLKSDRRLTITVYSELLSVGIFVLFFLMHTSVEPVYRFSCYYWIPIALIILTFAFQGGYISKLLSNKYFVYLGNISFGFYMFHALIIEYGLRLNEHYHVFEKIIIFLFFVYLHYQFLQAL